MFKRALCLFLILSILTPTALAAGISKVTTYDGRFQDISGWYEEYVIAAYESGLVNGTGAGRYSPDATLQVNAAVTLAARVHKLYHEGNAAFASQTGSQWYRPYYDYCIENQLFTAEQIPDTVMNHQATRNQVMAIFDKVLPDEELEEINRIADNAIPDVPVSDPQADAIYKFYRAGVLTGDNRHCFNGETSILRGEMAAILTRLTGLSPRSHLTLQEPSQFTTRTDVIVVDGVPYTLGMGEADLLHTPAAVYPSMNGFTWYIFTDADYGNTFFAGVRDGYVRSLSAIGAGFTYCGMEAGDHNTLGKTSGAGYQIRVLTDSNDGNVVYGVCLTEDGLSENTTAEALSGEAMAQFYAANAFRHYHGCSPLAWDANTAQAALLHAMDMSANGYFSHNNLDGHSPGTRLNKQGVTWQIAGENIARNSDLQGILVLDRWVNSKTGHRDTLLHPDFRYIGISAYPAGQQRNWVQDFYG